MALLGSDESGWLHIYCDALWYKHHSKTKLLRHFSVFTHSLSDVALGKQWSSLCLRIVRHFLLSQWLPSFVCKTRMHKLSLLLLSFYYEESKTLFPITSLNHGQWKEAGKSITWKYDLLKSDNWKIYLEMFYLNSLFMNSRSHSFDYHNFHTLWRVYCPWKEFVSFWVMQQPAGLIGNNKNWSWNLKWQHELEAGRETGWSRHVFLWCFSRNNWILRI